MSHFAHLSNGVVDSVLVAEADFVAAQPDPQNWVQTSYNSRAGIHYGQDGERDGNPAIGFNYAGVGMLWDGTGFHFPQPFPSWTLNKATYQWEAPVPIPSEGGPFSWDEIAQAWVIGN